MVTAFTIPSTSVNWSWMKADPSPGPSDDRGACRHRHWSPQQAGRQIAPICRCARRCERGPGSLRRTCGSLLVLEDQLAYFGGATVVGDLGSRVVRYRARRRLADDLVANAVARRRQGVRLVGGSCAARRGRGWRPQPASALAPCRQRPVTPFEQRPPSSLHYRDGRRARISVRGCPARSWASMFWTLT